MENSTSYWRELVSSTTSSARQNPKPVISQRLGLLRAHVRLRRYAKRFRYGSQNPPGNLHLFESTEGGAHADVARPSRASRLVDWLRYCHCLRPAAERP